MVRRLSWLLLWDVWFKVFHSKYLGIPLGDNGKIHLFNHPVIHREGMSDVSFKGKDWLIQLCFSSIPFCYNSLWCWVKWPGRLRDFYWTTSGSNMWNYLLWLPKKGTSKYLSSVCQEISEIDLLSAFLSLSIPCSTPLSPHSWVKYFLLLGCLPVYSTIFYFMCEASWLHG